MRLVSGVSEGVPPGKRRVIAVGGFAYNEGPAIKAEVERLAVAEGLEGVEKYTVPGPYCEMAKIHFVDNRKMWACLTRMKGRKFESVMGEAGRRTGPGGQPQLWHGIDKLGWEIQLSKRQRQAKTIVIDYLVEKEGLEKDVAMKCVDDFSDNGDVILTIKNWPKAAEQGHTRPIKLLEQDRATHHLQVCKASTAKLTALGWSLDLSSRLVEINTLAQP